MYVSVLLNRSTNTNMIMYSPEGGVEIEKVAEETPNWLAGIISFGDDDQFANRSPHI